MNILTPQCIVTYPSCRNSHLVQENDGVPSYSCFDRHAAPITGTDGYANMLPMPPCDSNPTRTFSNGFSIVPFTESYSSLDPTTSMNAYIWISKDKNPSTVATEVSHAPTLYPKKGMSLPTTADALSEDGSFHSRID